MEIALKDMEVIRKALKEKIWITNSNKGFTPTLVKVLEEHFFGK